MVVVSDGDAEAVIVVPDNAHRTEQFAAEELQKYIEQMSGAQLEIISNSEAREEVDPDLGPARARILVGNVREARHLQSRLRRADSDAFIVKTERQAVVDIVGEVPGRGHDLYLIGAEERGTLYAAYDFLERELGCRWLGPSELWSEVPERSTVTVPTGERLEAPGMKYRVDFALEDFPESTWGLKHKINVTRRQIRLPFEWMRERFQEEVALPMEARGWLAYHESPVMLRALELDRPEMFALTDDQRRSVASMCFQNPEVHDLLADRLSRILRERPELDFVEVGAVDGLSQRYCRCDRCMDTDRTDLDDFGRLRGEQTHRWLSLVNPVAERLGETDPEKSLMAAAYAGYQKPPDPEVITPADNVMITYWTWTDCRLHGFEHEDDPDPLLDETISHSGTRDWLERWRDVTPRGVILSEYVSRAAMHGMTGSQPARFVGDMNYLHRNGHVGYLAFGGPTPWGFYLINRYAVARSMWDPELDPDELVADFCDHAFHAASEPMQQLFELVAEAMDAAGCSHMTAMGWMTDDALEQARAYMDAAVDAAGDNETVQRRLRQFEMHLNYSRFGGPAYNRWLRVVTGERDPQLMREAIELGQNATEYRAQMLDEHGDARRNFTGFHASTGARIRRNVLDGGSWHRLLDQLEQEQQ